MSYPEVSYPEVSSHNPVGSWTTAAFGPTLRSMTYNRHEEMSIFKDER
jgi:hypothetical protein